MLENRTKFKNIKGLTTSQLDIIVQLVQKYHSFGWIPVEERINKDNFQLHIKYIDPCYDSRFGDWWAISFRGFSTFRFATNLIHHLPEDFPFDNLYEWIIKWLHNEWKPDGVYEKLIVNNLGDEYKPNEFKDGKIYTFDDLNKAKEFGNIESQSHYNHVKEQHDYLKSWWERDIINGK